MSFFVLWNTTEDILKNVFVFWSIKCKLIKSKAVWIPMFFKYSFVFCRTKKNDMIEFSGHYLQTFSCFCFFFFGGLLIIHSCCSKQLWFTLFCRAQMKIFRKMSLFPCPYNGVLCCLNISAVQKMFVFHRRKWGWVNYDRKLIFG